ncbi:hypothetical protein B0I37DRAFT_362984 [Chaetomium sp. MPI-CAGE-AT-0009]|nr:hypothetical protein B0I37DRAFT_362984 [Chaetomium sp. MPI-CAGE-AT-0009]
MLSDLNWPRAGSRRTMLPVNTVESRPAFLFQPHKSAASAPHIPSFIRVSQLKNIAFRTTPHTTITMGRSYQKNPSTTAKTPPQWKDQVRHKYCGALDNGREGKPNKVHRCEACLAVKARQSKFRDGPGDIKLGRKQKMSLKFGGGEES